MTKRGDAGAIATFVLLMGLFVIGYVLLVSDEERAKLLDTTVSDARGGSGVSLEEEQRVLFSTFVGAVTPVTKGEILIPFTPPPIKLFSTEDENRILLSDRLEVASGFSGSKPKTLFFELDSNEDVSLFFFVDEQDGDLTITVNENIIFQGEVNSNGLPIRIPKGVLKDINTIKFSASGNLFGSKYKISDVAIVERTRLDRRNVKRNFEVPELVKAGLSEAALTFFVNCARLDEGNTLTIRLNGRTLYEDLIFCDAQKQTRGVSVAAVKGGTNTLEFEIDNGNYELDDVELFLLSTQATFPKYNFDVGDNVLRGLTDCRRVCDFECGFDDLCFDDCMLSCGGNRVFLDMSFRRAERKHAAITINEFEVRMDTIEPFFVVDITDYLRLGSNAIKIVPFTEFEIEELKVVEQGRRVAGGTRMEGSRVRLDEPEVAFRERSSQNIY